MGLLLGIVLLIVLGICSVADFTNIKNLIGEIIAVIGFYWIGTLFASPAEVLSFSWSMSTVIAGFFYAIALLIVWMKIVCIFK